MRKLLFLSFFLLGINGQTALAATNPDAYSLQDVLIGATPSLQASANNGAGVVFGDIDTGVTPQWVGFTSQYNTALPAGASNINKAASAVCLNGVCPVSNAFPTDENGHGTFTASEMVGGIPSIGMEGVDPAATLIAVQVLNANGSGYSNDVANGIVYAVNRGAEILNLSLGPSGTAAQQAAFYESLASAVNYAASKGAIVVFAGGNSSEAFAGGADITGFTNQALSHMFFMGSTNASEKLSSFSNTPGTAGFISTTGTFVPYDIMWMMADGQNIWGASNYYTSQYGYSYITQMSGTSMAAPQGAGAAGLLAAKWPFLLSTGTIPQILEETATNLGTKGVNSVYGDGFLNLISAFQPVGTLDVPVNGKMEPLSSAQIVSGAALGNMSKLSSVLTTAVGYDKFMRGFLLGLSSSIVTHASTLSVSQATALATGQSGVGARSFTDLGEDSWSAFSGSPPDAASFPGDTNLGLTPLASHAPANDWSYELEQNGRFIGIGEGSTNAALAFGDARFGNSSAFAFTNGSAAGSLLGIVSGGHFASIGVNLDNNARVAASFISANDRMLLSTASQTPASAQGTALSYTMQPLENVKVSLATSFLNEGNMLLGSSSNGLLGLASSASTASFGVGTNIGLGNGYQLGLDAAYATTGPAANAASLIGSTSRLASDSFSLAMSKDNVSGIGDALGISLDKPLRVFSGTANVDVPIGTDNNGNPIIQNQRVSMVPTGNETDLGLTYNRPLAQNLLGSFNLSYRNDADNVSGAQDCAAMLHLKLNF